MKKEHLAFAIYVCIVGCASPSRDQASSLEEYAPGTFGYDLAFLKKRDDVAVLHNGEAQLIVSPLYQGKVFTSTAEGPWGKSFGWINYDAFDRDPDPHMNAYGGENRLWLGPEGNRFSLFFQPGAEMSFENWVTPAAIDTEAWTVEEQTDKWITLSRDMVLTNYAGTTLTLSVSRGIRILPIERIEQILDLSIDHSIKAVGYSTSNEITNTGEEAWTNETGAPCIWILDMFKPSPSTTIILPYNEKATGKIATTDYFGEIPRDRIAIGNGVVQFRGDGKLRGKIGLAPQRAKPLAASFDEENSILTVVTFDVDHEAVYLNQEWTLEKDAFAGDAVNAYNDGPLDDGSQMGPFYELESVSPAAFLKPGEKLSHVHSVFHFTGEQALLKKMMGELFGPAAQASTPWKM